MRVWLEASPILNPKYKYRAGITQYSKRLIEGLLAVDHKNSYSLFGNLFFTARPLALAGHYSLKLVRFLPGKIWNQLIKRGLLPPVDQLIGSKPDIAVFFNFVRLPMSKGVKTITIVHDLGFIDAPQYITGPTHKYLEKVVPSIKQSTHIIAISEFTKSAIIKNFNVPASAISVVPPAVDTTVFKPTPPTDKQRKRYHLPDKYIVFVGTLEPRKNVQGLVAAYSTLPESVRSEYALVLAGSKGWLDESIQASIDSFKGPGSIVRTGFVEDADQPAVYSGATLFVYPSFYEGYGMPVVEAMACGVPVITATSSSLPEAAGGAAILVDPSNTEQLTQAIQKTLKNPKRRQELAAQGHKRVASLTWENSATLLQQCITEVGHE